MLQLGIRGLGIARFKFNPISWFLKGEPGAWYDPSDFQPNWRRNLLTWSEDFSDAAWQTIKSGTNPTPIKTPNYATAPDGTQTACRLQCDSSTQSGSNYALLRYATSGTLTNSIWAKSNTGSSQVVLFSDYNSAAETITVTTTWQRFLKTGLTTSLFDIGTRGDTSGSNIIDILIWHPQAEQSSSASTYQKITDGIQDYYTVQPQPVLFQNSSGTIPVTAVEQPVGLMLDKSKGLALGAELLTNGTFDTNVAGWSASLSMVWSAANGGCAIGSGSAGSDLCASTLFVTTIGQSYIVTANIIAVNMNYALSAGLTTTTYSSILGLRSFIFTATTTSSTFYIRATGASGVITFDNISVKQIAGNHAFQATAGNRPVLSARVNMLTKTEDFSDAVWAKGTTLSATANVITSTAGGSSTYQAAPLVGNTYKAVFKVAKTTVATTFPMLQPYLPGTPAVAAGVILNTNTGIATPVAPYIAPNITVIDKSTYWELSFDIHNVNAVGYVYVYIYPAASANGTTYNGTATGSVTIYGVDIRPTNSGALLPPYQRVNTASDYDTVGFPLYLKANGTSSAMSTNSIDFTSTDKMTVVTGVRKLSDAVTAVFIEISPDALTTSGAFAVAGPAAAGTMKYAYWSRGTSALAIGSTNSEFAAPITNVITGQTSIATPLMSLRLNSNQVAISSSTLGTGNFGNYPLYLFARVGTGYFLNGHFYGAIIRGAASGTASVTQTEQYMAQKTGITF